MRAGKFRECRQMMHALGLIFSLSPRRICSSTFLRAIVCLFITCSIISESKSGMMNFSAMKDS